MNRFLYKLLVKVNYLVDKNQTRQIRLLNKAIKKLEEKYEKEAR